MVSPNFTLFHSPLESIPAMLTGSVPEFAESPEYSGLDDEDRSVPALIFGAFALFLVRQVEGGTSMKSAGNSYKFLEQLSSLNDANVDNMIMVDLFELIDVDENSAVSHGFETRTFKLFQRWSAEFGLSPGV